MHLLLCAEMTVVFDAFQAFMVVELCDLCRWHIIFAEGVNHGLSGVVIAEFIVLKPAILGITLRRCISTSFCQSIWISRC